MEDAVTRLDVPGTYNFREVAPGSLTPGQLYRSDALHRLNRAGRRPHWRARNRRGDRSALGVRPPRRWTRPAARHRRGAGSADLPIDGAPRRRTDITGITLSNVYRIILSRHQQVLGRVIREIAAAEGPVLVHCTAGKDRTGLVVALTLSALGIDRDIILADYAATAANLAGEWTQRMVGKARRFRVHLTDDLLVILGSSPPEVLADASTGWIASCRRHRRMIWRAPEWMPRREQHCARSCSADEVLQRRARDGDIARARHPGAAGSGARPVRAAGCCPSPSRP